MKQTTFASLAFDRKKKPTRRERFLAEMETVVPWAALLAVIEPHYPKSGLRDRSPIPTILQIHFMQQWYALSDPTMEDALYEIVSIHHFGRLEMTDDAMPNETTTRKLRYLLEKHGRTAQMMNIITETLEQRDLPRFFEEMTLAHDFLISVEAIHSRFRWAEKPGAGQALQGDREERRKDVLADRIDQSFICEASRDELMGEIRPPCPETSTWGPKSPEVRQ